MSKQKEDSSFSYTYTRSQWAAIDTLITIFREPLPPLPIPNHCPLPKHGIVRANERRRELWELLHERVLIEHRIVEHVTARWGNPKRDRDDYGLWTREVAFDVTLVAKQFLRAKDGWRVDLRLLMKMAADVDEWHVREINFIPLMDQQEIFRDLPLDYRIVI